MPSTRRSKLSANTEVGRLAIDETFKPEKKAKQMPNVGRIESIHVDEKPQENETFPSQPEIGSFIFKTVTKEEKQEKVHFSMLSQVS